MSVCQSECYHYLYSTLWVIPIFSLVNWNEIWGTDSKINIHECDLKQAVRSHSFPEIIWNKVSDWLMEYDQDPIRMWNKKCTQLWELALNQTPSPTLEDTQTQLAYGTLCLDAFARFIGTACMRRIRWSCEGLMSTSQQTHWIQLKHLLLMTMYNLSLPKLMLTTTGCLRLCNSGLLTRADVHCLVSRGQLPRYCTVPA